jgi:hypothetical protein
LVFNLVSQATRFHRLQGHIQDAYVRRCTV